MNAFNQSTQRVALVTGGSAGLGRALVTGLLEAGWVVITDARRGDRLGGLPPEVIALPGDITDAAHKAALGDEVARHGRLDLLVHNASNLGPTPLPRLDQVSIEDLQSVWRPNIGAPLVLTRSVKPRCGSCR